MEIVLTADKTLMSNHHGKEFMGFGTSAPPNWLPEFLFRYLFFPRMKSVDGFPWQAPYGLRKMEAKLIDEGFDVKTVYPDNIDKYDPKVIGVSVMDPFGWGPSSTTFAGIMKTGDPYLEKYFRLMLESDSYRKAKAKGAKTIVGGPGTWQFKLNKSFMKEHGIDSVIIGEGEHEKVIEIYRMALEGRELPEFVELKPKEAPSVDEISEIKNPSVNGLVEIGRGCPRGCKFCSVTLRPLRWYPYEKIEKEIKVNVDGGVKDGILHAEDILLYGQKGVIPDEEKQIKLHKLAKRYYKNLSWSHASFAAVASKAKLMEELSEIILDENQSWWGAEMGIETGSVELAKKIMPAKAKPFRAEEWPEVVIQGAKIMKDCHLIPACTLITGLPEETEDDVMRTIELVDDLKDFPSLIVPLFFVPMGKLKDRDWFKKEDMSEAQKELLINCLRHDIRWTREISKIYFSKSIAHKAIKPLFFLFFKLIEWQAKRKEVI